MRRKPDFVTATMPDGKLHYFNYVVLVWDEHRLAIDHCEAATMNLEDIRPAFRMVVKRLPNRWVTLQSKNALVGDSERFEALDEVDL